MMFKMESVTYVTALYNLRKREGHDINTDHFSRMSDYLEVAKTLLNTPLPFVIVCEPDLEAPLREIRGDRPTVFHAIAFEDLPFWSLLPTIRRNNLVPVIGVSPEKFTDLYYLIINHKAEFVRQAAEANPFGTDWFAWVDVRITLPSTHLNGLTQWWDPRRMNLAFMNCIGKHCPDFFRFNHGWVAGGFFAGQRDIVIEFTGTLISEWKQALSDGYCPSDETMLAFMACTRPEWVTGVSFGDYSTLLRNQAAVCDRQWIVYNIQEFSLAHGHVRTSIQAGEGLRRGDVTPMADHEQFHVYYRLMQAYGQMNHTALAAERKKELFTFPHLTNCRRQFLPHDDGV